MSKDEGAVDMNEVPSELVKAVRAASGGMLSNAESRDGVVYFVFVRPELTGLDGLKAGIEKAIDDYRDRTGDRTEIRIKIEL